MKVVCPKCEKYTNVDIEDMPSNASDDAEVNCDSCEHEFTAGWFPEVEVRDSRL